MPNWSADRKSDILDRMGRFLLKVGDDEYLEWSTVVDAPVAINCVPLLDALEAAKAAQIYLQSANPVDQQEGRVEYRVVGEGREGVQTVPCPTLAIARREAHKFMHPAISLIRPRQNVRIQESTVTESRTQWTDIDQKGAGTE